MSASELNGASPSPIDVDQFFRPDGVVINDGLVLDALTRFADSQDLPTTNSFEFAILSRIGRNTLTSYPSDYSDGPDEKQYLVQGYDNFMSCFKKKNGANLHIADMPVPDLNGSTVEEVRANNPVTIDNIDNFQKLLDSKVILAKDGAPLYGKVRGLLCKVDLSIFPEALLNTVEQLEKTASDGSIDLDRFNIVTIQAYGKVSSAFDRCELDEKRQLVRESILDLVKLDSENFTYQALRAALVFPLITAPILRDSDVREIHTMATELIHDETTQKFIDAAFSDGIQERNARKAEETARIRIATGTGSKHTDVVAIANSIIEN